MASLKTEPLGDCDLTSNDFTVDDVSNDCSLEPESSSIAEFPKWCKYYRELNDEILWYLDVEVVDRDTTTGIVFCARGITAASC